MQLILFVLKGESYLLIFAPQYRLHDCERTQVQTGNLHDGSHSLSLFLDGTIGWRFRTHRTLYGKM